jgi:hypothetical protein
MLGNQYLLVMTACIDPGAGHATLQRADPAVRRRDYEEALRFWLGYPDPRINRILFIENSGASLSSLEEIVRDENPLGKEVEFVGLDCNWYPPGGHYCYAEMRMLDLGLEQSALARVTSHMIKATGRLKFPALSALLDRTADGVEAMADSRLWRTPFTRHAPPFVCTQIILFSHRFYRDHLAGACHELETGSDWIESLYFRKLYPLHRQSPLTVVMRFPCNVDPVGQPAHRLESYTDPRQQAVNAARAVLRRVAPWWWI